MLNPEGESLFVKFSTFADKGLVCVGVGVWVWVGWGRAVSVHVSVCGKGKQSVVGMEVG